MLLRLIYTTDKDAIYKHQFLKEITFQLIYTLVTRNI